MLGSRRLVTLALLVGALLAAAAASARGADRTLHAHGSVKQAYAIGLRPRAHAVLLRHGRLLRSRRADADGGVLFTAVAPGRGYRIRSGARISRPLLVMTARDAPPNPKLYHQQVTALPAQGELSAADPANYQYLTTRDGTKLAIDVHTPPGPGPWPTLVEYSGYGYATPYGPPQSGLGSFVTLLGYAVVDVNMRGTGCSGGAFSYFERLQALDGYDVIQTIAHQRWVLRHRVGMLGISYGGISQLFVAATDPPALAAIAPLSVIDSSQTTLYPGGILNTGFALTWGEQRVHDGLPASPHGGQAWAYQRIRQGDETCAANQALHGEATNLVRQIHRNADYVPSVANPLDPVTFVHRIHAPSFVVCQFTDEQTGGHCPALAQAMTGTRRKWFTFTNGAHIDSLDPYTLTRLIDFYDLYVEHRAPPVISASLRSEIGGVLYQAEMGISGVALPPDPIQGLPSYRGALAKFDALPEIRVMFDNGAGKGPLGNGKPGDPYPGFVATFKRFPIPGTRARSWYLGPHGSLAARASRRAGADRFTWNPRARPATDLGNPSEAESGPGGVWTASPDYRWSDNPAGAAASYVTAPLARNLVAVGAGAVQAWVRRVEAQRRSTGDRFRGPARRPRDVRAERLVARRRACAEPADEHAARATADVHRRRRAAAAGRSLHEGHDPALLRGPRLPSRLADPRDDLCPRRRPAAVGVREHESGRHREGLDRPLAADAVAARAASRRGGACPDRATAMPGAARRTVPRLPRLSQRLGARSGRQQVTALGETGAGPCRIAAGAWARTPDTRMARPRTQR